LALGLLRFTNALGGTADFIYPGPSIDMQSPASDGAVDGTTYLYYAQSFDMSQWEIGQGAYTASSGTFARTSVSKNSLGTTAKINFGDPPQVIVFDRLANAADIANFIAVTAQSWSDAQKAQARSNIGFGTASGQIGERIPGSGSISFAASGTPANICFIDVPAGTWDLEYFSTFGGPGATTSSDWITAISTTNASVSSGVVGFGSHTRLPSGADMSIVHSAPRVRVTPAVTTRYYLNAQATYAVSTYSVSGTIQATRTA